MISIETLEKIKKTFEGRGFKGRIIPEVNREFTLSVNKEVELGIEVTIYFYQDERIDINFPAMVKNVEQAFMFKELYNDAMDCLAISINAINFTIKQDSEGK